MGILKGTHLLQTLKWIKVLVRACNTSSVSDPKRRRSNGIAATRSMMNQPLKWSLINILIRKKANKCWNFSLQQKTNRNDAFEDLNWQPHVLGPENVHNHLKRFLFLIDVFAVILHFRIKFDHFRFRNHFDKTLMSSTFILVVTWSNGRLFWSVDWQPHLGHWHRLL